MGGEIAPFGAVLLRSESAADHVDVNAILAMHRALMGVHAPGMAGRWREEQVWIGGSSLGPHGASFVPPHQSRVPAAMDDLAVFMQRDDLPVLVHAAIAHAQFATIHPFPGGNGRTGRALLHSMLRNKALTRNVTVPVSAGLLLDTGAYFEALGAYRAGDPTVMIRQLSEASFVAVANGRHLVTELREIRGGWNTRLSARRDSAVWQVTDLLMRHPVINGRLLTRELGIAASNVYRYIGPLVRADILVEFTDQKRNRAWRSTEILAALDGFAARAGRRRLPT
jgi:Fic family protein